MPLASVATEPPNAVTARCCGTGPTISALSAPRIQAGKVNGSECTFSKPAAFSLASAHATARSMGFGAGQTLSDLGGQRFHEIEGGGIVERSLSEARSGDRQRLEWRRGGGLYRDGG